MNGKVRFMTCNLDTVFVATKDTMYPEYVFDFEKRNLPKDMRHVSLSERRKDDNYDNYFIGMRHIYETPTRLIFHFSDDNYPEHLSEIPEDTRRGPKKLSEFIEKNAPCSEYYLFVNKATGKIESFSKGVIISNFGCNTPLLSYVDREYLLFSNVIIPFLFMNGKISMHPVEGNPGYSKAVDEAYAKVNEQSNPVIYIYKMKD